MGDSLFNFKKMVYMIDLDELTILNIVNMYWIYACNILKLILFCFVFLQLYHLPKCSDNSMPFLKLERLSY